MCLLSRRLSRAWLPSVIGGFLESIIWVVGREARAQVVYAKKSLSSQSCLMTALQMGYLTGRREVAYANTEACIAFTRSRGVVLPYDGPRYYPPAGTGRRHYWNGRNGQ